MIKKKYIVSGNYDEYLEYLHIKSRTDINNMNVEYIYVNSAKDLVGVIDIEGFYIGTYFKRPDIDDIKERIALAKHMSNTNKDIDQLAERINANKEISYTNEYSVENYFHIGNGRYVAKEQYKPAEDSVYGNVSSCKFKWTENIE
jgi:hypothetical protein